MKQNSYAVLIILFAVVISSCNKEDKNSKKLYRHEGRWTIDKVTIETFDTLGKIMIDSSIVSPGELVMMRTKSFNALYGYHQAVFIYSDTLGTHGAPFEYLFDGERIDIRDCKAPFAINGAYTSVVDKGNEQQWEIYTPYTDNSIPTSLYAKFSMHLSKSKN